MILQDSTLFASAPARNLLPNEKLVLAGEPRLLSIRQGHVLLYAAEVKGQEQVGPRRLLKKLHAGQSVMIVPQAGIGSAVGLLALAEDEVEFAVVDIVEHWQPRSIPPQLLGQVEQWVDLLYEVMGDIEPPRYAERLQSSGRITFEEDLTIRVPRRSVFWVSLESGTAVLRGDERDCLAPGEPRLPLARTAWVEAKGPGVLQVDRTEDLPSAEAALSGLSNLQSAVLQHLHRVRESEDAREAERLRERERIQEARMALALGDIASIFEPRSGSVSPPDPLLAAITCMGDSLGLKIIEPKTAPSSRVEPVEAIARANRLRWRRVALTGTWWKEDCGPILAFTAEEDFPVAIVPGPHGRYECFDPADGSRVRIDAELAESLDDEGIVLYRPLPEGKLTLKDLLRFTFKPRASDIALASLASVILTLLAMLIPQATAVIMDSAIPDSDRRLLLELGAGLLVVTLARTLFNFAQVFLLLRVGLIAEADGQSALWDRLLRLRPNFFRQYPSGDLQSRVSAVSQIGQKISGALLSTIFSGGATLLNLGLLFYYSPKLTIVACVASLLVVSVVFVTGHLSRKQLQVLMDLGGKFFGTVVQLVSGVGKLRVAGAMDRAFTHWVKGYSEQLRLRSRIQQIQDTQMVFHHLLPAISSLALLYFSYEVLASGREANTDVRLTLGGFLAFNAAYGTFLGGMIALAKTAVGLQDVAVLGNRIAPILEEEPEVDETKSDPGNLVGRVELEDLTFRYNAGLTPTLNRVSMFADPGEFIAVVGPSGSGKSTALRLLLGFEVPEEGRVLYDGQNLAGLDVLAVRRQVGVVLQSGKLDAASIFDNIACGNLITLEEAWAAANDAGIGKEIEQMPMGMHTVVSVGGANLSGGQRQRLLIARALVQQHKVLFFDEATSALDNKSQLVVSESLERMQATRVVIAHRMSTIRKADRIYVMEDGEVRQVGSFDALMEDSNGLFAKLMQRQLA